MSRQTANMQHTSGKRVARTTHRLGIAKSWDRCPNGMMDAGKSTRLLPRRQKPHAEGCCPMTTSISTNVRRARYEHVPPGHASRDSQFAWATGPTNAITGIRGLPQCFPHPSPPRHSQPLSAMMHESLTSQRMGVLLGGTFSPWSRAKRCTHSLSLGSRQCRCGGHMCRCVGRISARGLTSNRRAPHGWWGERPRLLLFI